MPRCEMCGEWPDCPWKTDPEIMCGEFHPKPITNADRIRGMTDEELAELLEGCICPKSPCPDIDRDTPTDKKRCTKCWLDWLKEEAT